MVLNSTKIHVQRWKRLKSFFSSLDEYLILKKTKQKNGEKIYSTGLRLHSNLMQRTLCFFKIFTGFQYTVRNFLRYACKCRPFKEVQWTYCGRHKNQCVCLMNIVKKRRVPLEGGGGASTESWAGFLMWGSSSS